MPQVSILVAVHDAEPWLPRLLRSLDRLQSPPGGFEVVAADNGSKDGSRQLLEQHRRRAPFPLTVVDASAQPGAGPARNRALAVARGEWLAIVDADDWVDPAWLVSLLAAARPGRIVVTRRVSADVVSGRSLGDPWDGVLRGQDLPPTGCTSYLIEAQRVRELGGWHEAGLFLTGEDGDLVLRALTQGAELHPEPTALYHHSRPASVRATLRKAMRYARDDFAIARSHHADFLTRSPALFAEGLPRGLSSLLIRTSARMLRWRHPSALFDLGKTLGHFRYAHTWPGDVALLEQAQRQGRPLRPLLEPRTWSFWSRDLAPEVRLLTFDDGPQPGVTDRMLDLLASAGQKATFFVVGRRAKEHPELLRRIHAEGHEIANHTFDHPRVEESLDVAASRHQILATQEVVVRICGESARPRWFRPPWGRFTPAYKLVLRQEGLCWALWTCDPRDWRRDATPASIVRTCLDPLAPVLIDLHDATEPHPTFVHPRASTSREATLAAMECFLPEATRRGLRCLTLSQAFAAALPPLASEAA
jgi:peptidoglycan/xylan/chitin deacetylase (PgdA/CDA1 family)/glycosyltransferase involved in cell wall biosynthesis